MKDDKSHGLVREVYHNNIFEGLNKDGVSVFGRCIWDTGEYYIGSWKNNKRDGYGQTVYPSGRVEKGIWKKSKFIR